MLRPIKVIDIELSRSIQDIKGLSTYMAVQGLVRLYGKPIGYVTIPVYGDFCPANDIIESILDKFTRPIIKTILSSHSSKTLDLNNIQIKDLIGESPPVYINTYPLVTVAVCTRDRTIDLKICLESLMKLEYPNLEILVVDNAPTSSETRYLVNRYFPAVRYIHEPRPGLNWARNRAHIEAHGEIVAYTDDDVVVDPGWVNAVTKIFTENDEVMAVTGLVVPYELETESQILFEKYGGFIRGFDRKWYRLHKKGKKEWYHIGAGTFGTGANMTFRRSLFGKIGHFDPALDVGTVTNGGGDLEMFFRVLQEGHTLVYEPDAIVRHRHRREYEKLRVQLTNNGIGLFSYFVRSAFNYPRELIYFILFGTWWFWWRWCMRRLLISYFCPFRFPRDLILSELRGSFAGLFRYYKAKRTAKKIEKTFGAVKPNKTMKLRTSAQLSIRQDGEEMKLKKPLLPVRS